MKLKLMIKQAIRDFKSKAQLYLTFTIFVLISIALIIGLISFNFNLQQNYSSLMNVAPTVQYNAQAFPFVSVNADHVNSMKTKNGSNRYQIEDGEFSNYVFTDILSKEFVSNDNEQNNKFRALNENELKILYNDLGWQSLNKSFSNESEIESNYFNNNIINFIGENSGRLDYNSLNRYQEILNLTTIDLEQIFTNNSNGYFDNLTSDDLSSNPNYVRFAAFSKINWFIRIDNRWFSSDPSDPFYEHNINYGTNLITKYVLETKIDHQPNSSLSGNVKGTKQKFLVGKFVSGFGINWMKVQNHPSAIVMEAFIPSEKWMEDNYNWNSPEMIESGGFKVTPEIFRDSELTKIKYYDRLAVDQIDKETLKNGTYAFVSPIFLKEQGFKLGDKISYYNIAASNEPMSYTIIGTAVSKNGVLDNMNKSNIYIPFYQGVQRKDDSLFGKNLTDISFSLPNYKKDFQGAFKFIQENIYQNFQSMLIKDSGYVNFWPWNTENYLVKLSETSVFFFDLIAYSLGILTLILLFVVFYFITDQSIKLQKTTLKFLKSLGSSNLELGFLTSISSLVPIIIGSGLGILGSFGVSQILISTSLTTFPFYFPPFQINYWAWLVLLGLMIIIFLMFFLMNVLIISGPILKLGQNTKPGPITRGYIAIKPAFKRLNPKVRIGISFMAKNILKNFLTFILLTASFGVVLFSVQFKDSSTASAHSFEKRYKPYNSVLFDTQNNSNSVALDMNFLEHYFPNIRENWQKPELAPLKSQLNQDSYYQGSLTTFLEEKDAQKTFIDARTNKPIPITGIKSDDPNKEGAQTGDQKFNELIKNQINEVLTAFDNLADLKKYEMNSAYDLKNFYIDKEYSFEILQQGTSREHAEIIFSLDDKDIDDYAKRIKTTIEKIETKFGVKILEGSDEDEKLITITIFVKDMQQAAIDAMEKQFEDLKATAINVKTNFNEFDFKINLYFNRNILPLNGMQDTLMTTPLQIKGETIVGLGLDNRNLSTANMILQPLKPIEENKDNFKDEYNYYGDGSKEGIKVRAIDVFISGNLSDFLNIKKNDIIKTYTNGFGFDQGTTPYVYLRVNGVIREASYISEVYFNKVDLFNYLKLSLERPIDDSPAVENYQNRADYKFFSNNVEAIKKDWNGKEYFNNTVFSETNLPYGISNFSLNGKLAQAYSFLSYTYLPIFNYASQNYPSVLSNGSGLYVFKVVTKSLLDILAPIANALDKFIILLLLITAAVGLILITLILLENKNIILLFKSLGYKKGEVNIYLTIGYIVSTILAMILGATVAYFGIRISSKFLVANLNVSLFFVWSLSFILYAIILSALFITVTLISVTIYTDKQKPSKAFSDL